MCWQRASHCVKAALAFRRFVVSIAADVVNTGKPGPQQCVDGRRDTIKRTVAGGGPMAGSKRARPRRVSIEDRHALGRLAEVIGSQVDIAQDFDWLNEKYKLEAQPTFSSAVVTLAQAAQRSRVDPRFRLLSLIEAAYRKGSFQYLLGELL